MSGPAQALPQGTPLEGARLKIVQAGDPVLRKIARPLSPEEIVSPAIRELTGRMKDTMRDAPGVGLAAPQVGLSIQLAVIEDRAEYLRGAALEQIAERERREVPFFALFNPRIVDASEETAEFFEGCLSVSGFGALVRRSLQVTAEYLDENARPERIAARGWFARILQHEIDHLNGRLYIDRMEPRSFATSENLAKYWKDSPVAAVREQLGLNPRHEDPE